MIRRATRRVLGNAAAVFDRAATAAAYAGARRARKRNPAESLGHDERMTALVALEQLYSGAVRERFFLEPRAIDPVEREVRSLPRGGKVVDLCWSTDYETFLSDVAERYRRPANSLGAARLFLHPEPRPVAMCIHGYMAGQYAVEERMWPVRWLMSIGMDVALFVLPFHGVRADPSRRGPPPFPGSDPRVTNEGFRNAMGDFRDFVAFLFDRGHPSVGVMGMSLGGYSTSLALTVEPRLAFGVPIIPLASIADFAREQGRLGANSHETAAQHAALERVYSIVSPLHREPAIERRRILVIGAKADRITPVSHARRLANHFGAQLEAWHGGHLLQFGRSDMFRLVGRKLNELGVIAR